MPQIQLPDGSVRSFPAPVSVYDVALDIGPGLAKATLGGMVDGEQVDASYLITTDASLAIITAKDDKGLEIIRHSTAHLMAQAIKQLYPSVKVTIGPIIENGFYYDFYYPAGFSENDFAAIEERMTELAKQDITIERYTSSREEAIAYYQSLEEPYKVELVNAIPGDEDISFYKQGDFTDLCRGTHVPSTGHLKAFKLMKVAGAYWRGKAENDQLQRIYGTAFADKKQMKAYLEQLAEAEKRDHRKIGKKLDLFHMQEEAPGMVFWHEKGWTINLLVREYIRKRIGAEGYKEINTPQIVDRSLWEKSGHWDKYDDNMFTSETKDRVYAVKPMNCPCHVQVFNDGLKSYRDLPYRLAEFGSCHRNEVSGALHGIMRVRGFVQDDGHIFCAENQIQDEVSKFNDLLFSVYKDFGFTDIQLALSTRPEKRIGDEASWDKAEAALTDALNQTGLPWKLLPGEGAFYGPKIEYSLKDTIGRVWQCGTMQVDFMMPERLGASYIAEDNSKKTPVMLHRAILGSLERFIGILIEHHAGQFPLWLAPVQATILNISEKQSEFCLKTEEILKKSGFRVNSDLRNEKIGFKIREHTMLCVPYLFIVGDKEVQAQTVNVRSRSGEDLGSIPVNDLETFLREKIV